MLSHYFATGLHFGTRLAVLGMVQAWNPLNPNMAGAWNYPAWSLSAEAFFYLCFPLVFPWIARRSDRVLVWLIAMFALVCAVGHTPVMGLGDWKNHAALFERFLPLPVLRIPEFLLGVVLGLAFLRDKAPREFASRPWRVYPALVATVIVLSLPLGDWVSLVIVPFSVLVYELARGGSWAARFLSTRFMVLLGGASYSVYLLRYPVTSWTRLLISGLPAPFVRFGELLAPVLLVLFSILVFRYWEEPSGKALRKWFARERLWLSGVPAAPSPNARG